MRRGKCGALTKPVKQGVWTATWTDAEEQTLAGSFQAVRVAVWNRVRWRVSSHIRVTIGERLRDDQTD